MEELSQEACPAGPGGAGGSRNPHRGSLGIRFHDLRHTHATQLLREGIHPKVVSERLGHSAIAITLDIYSHVLPDMQQEAAEKLDVTMRQALQKTPRSL